MANEENQNCDGISFDSCSAKEDNISTSSSTSDASSSSTTGPLFQLSDLMSHLPIKRGLSKYYEGKSQSFKSFGGLKGLEDLAKEEKNPYKKRMKLGMSHMFCSPRPTIVKKGSSRSRLRSGSLLSPPKMVGLVRNDLLATCNVTTIPITKYQGFV